MNDEQSSMQGSYLASDEPLRGLLLTLAATLASAALLIATALLSI